MLDIDMEIRKGIMFIRLAGCLNSNTISKFNDDVERLLIDNGIRDIVLNLSNLKDIDGYGINTLLESYQVCKSNHGNTIICNINNLIKDKMHKSKLFNYIFEVDSEIDAMKLINI